MALQAGLLRQEHFSYSDGYAEFYEYINSMASAAAIYELGVENASVYVQNEIQISTEDKEYNEINRFIVADDNGFYLVIDLSEG